MTLKMLALAMVISGFIATPALAELPVDQCSDSGVLATSGGSEDFTPRDPNIMTLINTNPVNGNLGTVNPKTGAFVYQHEDISIGAGGFPDNLSVVRTYNTGVGGLGPNPEFDPHGGNWYAFGKLSTHNLDIGFTEGAQNFGNKLSKIVNIHFGFNSVSFQKCADGRFVNTKRNGDRLFVDNTYGQDGYRYETRSGLVYLFERYDVNELLTISCALHTKCGYLRKAISNNGAWAEFDYQVYKYGMSNYAEPHYSGYILPRVFSPLNECHITILGENECHNINYVTYYTYWTSGDSEITNSFVLRKRLIEVRNSKGYKIHFNYVDQDDGLNEPYPSNINTSSRNLRHRVQSIDSYTTLNQSYVLKGHVIYNYTNAGGGVSDFLMDFTSTTGEKTHFMCDSGFCILKSGQSVPAVVVRPGIGFAAKYFYPHYLRGGIPPDKAYEYAQVVSSLEFADGRRLEYHPTIANHWVPEPYGTWDWAQFISKMEIVENGTSHTFYDFVDEKGDHDGVTKFTDADGRLTTTHYNEVGTPIKIEAPEGNSVEYQLDKRGNVTSITWNPKFSGGLSSTREIYNYVGRSDLGANDCYNQLTCNKIVNKIDASGFQTDYYWSDISGLLTDEVRPADSSGSRPKIHYDYALFDNTSYLLVSRLASIDSNRNFVTTYGYDNDIRRSLRETVITDGNVTTRACFKSDELGNKISETSPRAGLAVCP